MLFYTTHQAPLELIVARDYFNNLGDYFSLFVFKSCYLYNKQEPQVSGPDSMLGWTYSVDN